MTSPVFRADIAHLPERMRAAMTGTSWQDDVECPRFESLCSIAMTHYDFDGEVIEGHLVVARDIADDAVAIFRDLFAASFPIGRMVPISHYGGDDLASMDDNNCSAFNFRRIDGTSKLSQHSFGTAIDINPVQNPWVRKGVVLPPAGEGFLDRSADTPGMIVRPGPVTDAFDARGWTWGGDWEDTKDFHHFSRDER
jgi:poly-gamma-glutamate synthesis protein (capsule biosynthesis protein)